MKIPIDQFAERVQALFFGRSEETFQRVGESTRNKVQKWYIDLPEDWFDNPSPFPDGTPRHAGTRIFMQPLGQKWGVLANGDGFSLIFAEQRKVEGLSSHSWGLSLQQYGKLVKPVEKKALTIPVTAEARNRSAKKFEQETGKKLFRVKKRDAKDPSHLGSLVWQDPEGDLHAAYVLRTSANIKPLKERRGHDAIPSAEQINKWAAEAYVQFIKDKFLYARY